MLRPSTRTSSIYNFSIPNRFNAAHAFPQGRNITQYQFIDDFSWTHGNHNFKFGENFRRYDVSDHNFFFNYALRLLGLHNPGLQEFANGVAYQYRKADNSARTFRSPCGVSASTRRTNGRQREPEADVGAARRAQLQPGVPDRLLRELQGPLHELCRAIRRQLAGSDPRRMYPTALISPTGSTRRIRESNALVWSPRFGFSWDPRGTGKTVISGRFRAVL